MVECPQCHSSIEISEQNFGTLFTCPMCHAVYFVGWDGNPEGPTAETPPLDMGSSSSEAPSISTEPFENNDVIEPEISSVIPLGAVQVDATPDFSDVVEFGNSPELEGPLTYSVFIKGIDISDTREKIKEALTDSRFAWDIDTIMNQIQSGTLTLPDLSPAKAVVLINRIKYLPIEVSWNQNVLS